LYFVACILDCLIFFVKRIMPLIWNFCCGFKWTKGQQNSWVVVHFVLHLLNLTENRKWHFIVHIHVYQYFCTQQSVNKFVTMNNMRTYSIKLQLHAQTTFALSVRTKKMPPVTYTDTDTDNFIRNRKAKSKYNITVNWTKLDTKG